MKKSDPDHNMDEIMYESGDNLAGEWIKCSLCGHDFDPGGLDGYVYCPKCGKRFNPYSFMDETVAIDVKPSDRVKVTPETLNEASVSGDESDSSGERFGEYDILSEIARGGMGVVYRARQRNLKRIVALKVLRGAEGATDEDLERFMREAKAAASLSHPNIVPIHELSVYKGKHFFTMDFIEGTPLDQIIDEGPLTPYHACELVETVSRAIHYAHTKGIIHRDLKPANIIIDTEGRPMLTDFGLAVNLSSDVRSQRMTRTGSVMGTIPYIPPEQAAGRVEQIDERSDVYSLGAVLYEMLVGRPPFQGETQFELLRRVIHQEVIPPRSINPKIHMDVETICLKCLDKDPNRRYASAEELAEDCRAFLHGEMIQARRASLAYRSWKKISRYRAGVAVVLCGIVAMGIAIRSLAEVHNVRSAQKEETGKLQEELETASREKETAEKEVEKYKETLERSWRKEFSVPFSQDKSFSDNSYDKWHSWLERGKAFLVPQQAVLRLVNTTNDDNVQPVFGLRYVIPHNFKINFKVRTKNGSSGNFDLLLNTGSKFDLQHGTYTISFGAPGHPGARITCRQTEDTLIAENSSFEIAPATEDELLGDKGWRDIEIMRVDGVIRVLVNREVLMSNSSSGLTEGKGGLMMAMGVRHGEVEIKDFDISVLGLNNAMIESLLEVAGTLPLDESKLARRLYERVAMENTSRDIRIQAYMGFARNAALLFRNKRSFNGQSIMGNEYEMAQLLSKINKSYNLEKGEREFAISVADNFALPLILKFTNNKEAAVRSVFSGYDLAAKRAKPLPGDLVIPGPVHYIGPFFVNTDKGFSEEFPPEKEFLPKAVYDMPLAAKNTAWIADNKLPNDGRKLYFNSKFKDGNSVFYVRRVFECASTQKVYIHTGSDDGLTMWVNGKQVLDIDGPRNVQPKSETTEVVFRPGENIVMMKIKNLGQAAGFSLQVEPDMKDAQIGVYGLLAKASKVILILQMGDMKNTARELDILVKDGTLQRLASEFPKETKAAISLAGCLIAIDACIVARRDLESLGDVLVALETLFPASGEEWAMRYHKLAKALESGKQLVLAETMYDKAIALSPKWHEPYFDRAMLLYKKGQPDRGKESLTEASEKLYESFDLQITIARFFLFDTNEEHRDPHAAILATQKAVQISKGKNPLAWEYYGVGLYRLNRYAEAREAVSKAIELEKTDERVKLLDEIEKAIEESVPMSGSDSNMPM